MADESALGILGPGRAPFCLPDGLLTLPSGGQQTDDPDEAGDQPAPVACCAVLPQGCTVFVAGAE